MSLCQKFSKFMLILELLFKKITNTFRIVEIIINEIKQKSIIRTRWAGIDYYGLSQNS